MKKNLVIVVGVLFSLAVVLYAWSSTGRVSRIEAGLGDLGLQVSGMEEKTAENLQRANEAYEKADLLEGRIVALEDDICDVIITQDQTTEKIRLLQESAGVVEGRIDDAESAIQVLNQKDKDIEKAVGELGQKTQGIEKLAQKANSQHSARIQTENREYLRMINYIREKNPGFEIGLKSDEEISKLLTNGEWDVEVPIREEYDRLIALTAQAGLNASMTALDRAEEAKKTADTALTTGATAVEAVQTIAEQPNRFLGRSVNGETKKRISSILKRRQGK